MKIDTNWQRFLIKFGSNNETKSRSISSWWMPLGFVLSLVSYYFELRDERYEAKFVYFAGLIVALMIIFTIKSLVVTKSQSVQSDLKLSEFVYVKLFVHILVIVMIVVLGWLCGDFTISLFKRG